MEPVPSMNRILFDAKQRYIEQVERSGNPTELSKGDNKEHLHSETDLKRVVSEANRYVVGLNVEFFIETHEATNRTIVQLRDIETDEIIKEFPPRELLDIVADIWEQVGILVDRTE